MKKSKEKHGNNLNNSFSLLALLNSKFPNRTIIFVKTKHDCHRLAIILGFHSMNACELHGNLSQ